MPKFDPKEPPKYGQIWQWHDPKESRPPIPMMLVSQEGDLIGAWNVVWLGEWPHDGQMFGLSENPDYRIDGWERLA